MMRAILSDAIALVRGECPAYGMSVTQWLTRTGFQATASTRLTTRVRICYPVLVAPSSRDRTLTPLGVCTAGNLTAWGFQDCARDTNNGAFGAALPRLLFRNLPRHYPAVRASSIPFPLPAIVKDR